LDLKTKKSRFASHFLWQIDFFSAFDEKAAPFLF